MSKRQYVLVKASVIYLTFMIASFSSEWIAAQGQEPIPKFWQSDVKEFLMSNGQNYTYDKVVELLNAQKGGELFVDGQSYPWIKLGGQPWIFDLHGSLHPCSFCMAGTGPLDEPPFDDDDDE